MIVMSADAVRVDGGTGSVGETVGEIVGETVGEIVGEGVTDRVIDSVPETDPDAGVVVVDVAVVETGSNMTSVGSTDGTGVSVAASLWRGEEARVGRGVPTTCP